MLERSPVCTIGNSKRNSLYIDNPGPGSYQVDNLVVVKARP